MTNASAEWVIAFAGSGDTTLANASALLDNWITDDMAVRDFIIPAKITKSQPGLENVVGYLTGTYDGFKTIPIDGFIDTLVNARADGLQVCLVAIIGDELPDDVTADLVEAAFEAGIPVKDLAAGLDDLVSSAEGTELPSAEPEAATETTGRRRRTRAAPPVVKPATATSAPSGGTRAKRRGTPRAEDPPWEPEEIPPAETEIGQRVDDAIAAETHHTGTRTTDSQAASYDDLRAMVAEEVRNALVTAFSGGAAALTGEAAHAQALTTAYIKDDDGMLRRRGKGKPRRGEEVVFLTDREADLAAQKGLIVSEA